MGYGTRAGGGGHTITTFWPDDTDKELYIDGSSGHFNLAEILEKAKEKWPDAKLENLSIRAEHIQTDCIYYDLYDSMDYTNFICIKLIE